jgi:hypothetical protein
MPGTPNIKKFYVGQPGTTASTVYTAPGNTTAQPTGYATAIIKDIWLVNTSASAATVTIGINGVAAVNQIVPIQSIPANTAVPISALNKLLNASDTIQVMQGTASAITVHIDGVEVQ